ncbi:MAG: efflux transporter outer membrane subunit [Methylobacter sp.]
MTIFFRTVCTVLLLSACTPTRVADNVPLPVPEHWQHAAASNAAEADLKNWWTGFNDPLLNDLIAETLAANQDLRIAKARVREAVAMVTVAESALYPTIELSASGGREKRIERIVGVPSGQGIALMAPRADMAVGGLSARWEIDVFGGRHLEAEAVSAQARGSEAAWHAVQVGVLAQVATAYLELRGVQKQLAVLRRNIELQREQWRALQAFNRGGLAGNADAARQETQLRATEAGLPVLQASATTLMYRLGVLSGKPPASLENRLALALEQSTAEPGIPRLLPSSLLSQRPDLGLAQSEVSTAAAALGAGRADLLPRLILSANGGAGTLAAGGFPSLAESVYALGSGLSAPIFSAGRIRARIDAADSRLGQAAAQYEKTFLLALEDVENAFVAHTAARQRLKELQQAQTSADAAVRQTDALYRNGAKDYLTVLDSRRAQLALEEEQVRAETASHVSIVSLYRAFGGGWSAEYDLSEERGERR